MLRMLSVFVFVAAVGASGHQYVEMCSNGTCADDGTRGLAQNFEFVQVKVVARKVRQGLVNITFKEASGGDWCSVECDDGQTLIGGGCNAKGPPNIMQYNGPSGINGWKCGGHGDKLVFAVCGTGISVEFKEASGGDDTEVQCDSGQKLVGGGCNAHSSPFIWQLNAPTGDDKWRCVGHGSGKQVWAACASISPVVIKKTIGQGETSVACDEGHQLIGGGCDALGNPSKYQFSMPNVSKGEWSCGGHGGDKETSAICYVPPTPSPTPHPTLSCRSITTAGACPSPRCAIINNKCSEYDWFVISANTSVKFLTFISSKKGSAADEQECANTCGGGSASFVYSQSRSKCWCVDSLASYDEWTQSDESTYYRVGADIFNGKVCRLDAEDKTTNGRGTVTPLKALSYDECMARCKSQGGCTGIEYTTKSSSCELWSQPIGYLKSIAGVECRSVLQTSPCTIADGSAASAVYPCSCGLATCGDSATACWALEDACKSLTPSPTPPPTSAKWHPSVAVGIYCAEGAIELQGGTKGHYALKKWIFCDDWPQVKYQEEYFKDGIPWFSCLEECRKFAWSDDVRKSNVTWNEHLVQSDPHPAS